MTGENLSLKVLEDQVSDGVDDVKKKNKAIVKAMVDADMTQQKLAEATGMYLTNINSIVNGTRPKVDTAIKIARALNTTVEKLWGDEVDVGSNQEHRGSNKLQD